MLSKKFKLSRGELDRFAALSQARAAAATKQGKFSREILPVRARGNEKCKSKIGAGELHTADEGIRPNTAV